MQGEGHSSSYILSELSGLRRLINGDGGLVLGMSMVVQVANEGGTYSNCNGYHYDGT